MVLVIALKQSFGDLVCVDFSVLHLSVFINLSLCKALARISSDFRL